MSAYEYRNSVTLEMLDDELAALVEAGRYSSEREVMRDALETLLSANPTLRLDMAISLWQQGKVTLGRAVEIAQSDRETFKEELVARGLEIVIDVDREDMLAGEKLIRQSRHNDDSV